MCPQNTSCVDDIGVFWTDEQLISCLESIQSGSPAPHNVFDDINPYMLHPSNLPEGIWYVVCSEDPKQAKVGIWKAKGDPCQVYSDSLIIGWRTTLEFYQGHSPSGHRTHWVMQEYSISDKRSTKFKGGKSLCQVFLSEREGETKKPDKHQENEGVRGQTDPPHDSDNKSSKSVESKLHVDMEIMEGIEVMFPHQDDNLLHADCFAEGDFLELRDLDEPQSSSSSSSDNSSCVTPSSDMYFDSVALLRELDDEAYQTNSSSNKLIASRQNDVVITMAVGGPPISCNDKTVEAVKVEASALPNKSDILEDAMMQPKPISNDEGPSSRRQTPGADKGKKVYRGKTIKKFLCFMAF